MGPDRASTAGACSVALHEEAAKEQADSGGTMAGPLAQVDPVVSPSIPHNDGRKVILASACLEIGQ